MPIEFKRLGHSGLKISPVIIGCMSYGSKGWMDWVVEDEEIVFAVFKKAYDAGLRTFDTADVYSNGTSERLLAKFIKKYNIPRQEIVILSKLYFPINTDETGGLPDETGDGYYSYVNAKGLSRRHIFEAVEASVERLGTYIDVLQIHRYDTATPKAETMRALHDVVTLGHVRYIGALSMKAVEFAQMQFVAVQNNWTKFISMQNAYNLLRREDEHEMIPFCKDNDYGEVGILPWSPIAGGVLARPLNLPSPSNRFSFALPLTPSDEVIVGRVEELAKKYEVSMTTIATSWVLSKGFFPVVGLSKPERVDDLLVAIDFKLSDADVTYLEEEYVAKAPQRISSANR